MNAHDTCTPPFLTHRLRHFVHIFFSGTLPSFFLSCLSLPLFSFSSFAQLLAMNYVLYPYGVRKVSLGIAFPT